MVGVLETLVKRSNGRPDDPWYRNGRDQELSVLSSGTAMLAAGRKVAAGCIRRPMTKAREKGHE
jgi:hypothetical protein